MSQAPRDFKPTSAQNETRQFTLQDLATGAQPSDDEFDFELRESLQHLQEQDKPFVLGEYAILSPIGAGGMGQVFRARHRTMDREVAIKILPQRLSRDPEAIRRFYAEVRAQAKLMHPNIVTAFDAGCRVIREHEVHYLAMELVDGESLADRIAREGAMPAAEVLRILQQAAQALDYAHGLGIVHRDIKPGNMMLTRDGTLKILDFGLAVLRSLPQEESGASVHSLVGTVEFMSPEQINAPETVDHRSDLYSLGATLHYMLIGRPMFSGEVIQTALAQLHRRPTPLYEIRGDIDLRFDSIFQWLVAKEVAQRCPSAHDLLEKLVELHLLPRPSGTTTVLTSSSPLPRLSRDHPTSLPFGTSASSRTFEPIGIELGMFHSRVSYVNAESKIEAVSVDGESFQLRNMLYSDAERVAIGAAAAAKRVQSPEQIFYGLQRWYGLPSLERPFGGRRVPPEVLVASVIRQLTVAARTQQPNASHAVVTVPGCYDQLHRISTRTACAIAGIEVLQLLDKPLAAALAFSEIEVRLAKSRGREDFQRDVLVLMLTGTACEAAVVRIGIQGPQTLALVGDWKRGMLRWIDTATKKLAAIIEERFGVSARDHLSLASQLQRTMERAMERLRHAAVVPFIIDMPKHRFEDSVRRDQLHRWIGDLEHDTTAFAEEAIRRAGIAPESIDALLLVGETRWLPQGQSTVRQWLRADVETVAIQSGDLARGAALQARALMPPIDRFAPLASGAASYDLGLLVQEESQPSGAPRILVPRDRSLPFQASRTLRFTKEGRRQPRLQWVEGSRLGGNTWHRLSRIDLQTCFPGRTQPDPIQLRMEIDDSGIWNGSLTWLEGNQQLAIPPLGEPLMDAVSMRQWRDWLESILLCNMDEA